MPVWRCPHCGTPQAESSRCWVCRRSTTSCGACRHYRRGIAVGLGVCGTDPRHPALRGVELRGCWEPADAERPDGWRGPVGAEPAQEPALPARVAAMAAAGWSTGRAGRTFVPVETADQRDAGRLSGVAVLEAVLDAVPALAPAPVTAAPAHRPRPRRIPGDWSLWGEVEA